jgi:ribose transport system substrate-binding protein
MTKGIERALEDFPRVEGRPPRRIGYVVNFSFHIWYKVVQAYMAVRAGQYGIEDILVRDARQDLPTQLAAVEELLREKVDALIVTPVPGSGTGAIVRKTREAGVPLVIEANPVPGMSTMVAICDYDAGVKAGTWTGEYLRNAGAAANVQVLDIAFPSLRPCLLRSEGFLHGLAQVVPGARLAERINGEAVVTIARDRSREALTRHPGVTVMFAMDDESLQGGLEAARELGMDESRITAVGFGLAGDEDKNRLVEGGPWKASLAMFPEWVGARCVDQAVRLANSHPVAVHDVVPTIPLSRESVVKYFRKENSSWFPDFTGILSIPVEQHCTKT